MRDSLGMFPGRRLHRDIQAHASAERAEGSDCGIRCEDVLCNLLSISCEIAEEAW